MSNPPLSDAQAVQPGWSEVWARGVVVRYRRSGAGQTVLILPPRYESHPRWLEFAEGLMADFRVISPSPPNEDADLDAWLSALLDGLGLSRVTVIAAGEFCMAAARRTLSDPEQLSAIVLVGTGDNGDDPMLSAARTTAQLSAVPMLLLNGDRQSDELLPALRRFLKGEDEVPSA